MEYQKPKELLNPAKSQADYQARQIAKETKDKWKIPFFIVSIIAFVVPSYQSYYYNSQSSVDEYILDELKQMNLLLNQTKESKPSFAKNDYSTHLEKDSLNYSNKP